MASAKALVVNDEISIPNAELVFTFVRSSGPGGQNVNKVNSKAVLRWNVSTTNGLPEDVRQRFATRYARRINDAGELKLTSQRFRDQGRNVSDCRAKLRDLILAVATAPAPRKATKIPRRAHEARLRQKRAVAEKKAQRRPPADAG